MKKLGLLFLIMGCLAGCDKAANTIQCEEYQVVFDLSSDKQVSHAVINGDGVDLVSTVSDNDDIIRYQGVLNDIDVVLSKQGKHWSLALGDSDVYLCK